MVRRLVRIVLGVGLFAAVVWALLKLAELREEEELLDRDPWAPGPPAGLEPSVATATPWVEPDGGACPATHPIKAKLKSGIYHLPGMQAYDRTHPDRCYAEEPAAQADGLRRAKR